MIVIVIDNDCNYLLITILRLRMASGDLFQVNSFFYCCNAVRPSLRG